MGAIPWGSKLCSEEKLQHPFISSHRKQHIRGTHSSEDKVEEGNGESKKVLEKLNANWFTMDYEEMVRMHPDFLKWHLLG